MCYFVSIIKSKIELEKRFDAKFETGADFKPLYFSSAFTIPELPFIPGDNKKLIQLLKWGLIPSWVKEPDFAGKIRYNTFNARFETIFEKKSFKHLILENRGILPVDRFFEWKEVNGKKYPYFIKLSSNSTFSLGGIWDIWRNPLNGEQIKTFSIITIKANKFLEKIHNTKKRMPLILNKEEESDWLNVDLSKKDIIDFVSYLKEKNLFAYPVSKDIKKIGNRKVVLKKIEYKEGLE